MVRLGSVHDLAFRTAAEGIVRRTTRDCVFGNLHRGALTNVFQSGLRARCDRTVAGRLRVVARGLAADPHTRSNRLAPPLHGTGLGRVLTPAAAGSSARGVDRATARLFPRTLSADGFTGTGHERVPRRIALADLASVARGRGAPYVGHAG